MFEHYSNPEVFEKSTGVRLPPFEVTEHELVNAYWQGDFLYTFTIEFDSALPDEFYHYLDSLVIADDNWTTQCPYGDSGCYAFESGLHDFFNMRIEEGGTKATIEYGSW